MVINLINRSSPGKQIPDKKWKSRKSFYSALLWRWTSYQPQYRKLVIPTKQKKWILQMMFLCHHLSVNIHFFDKKADKQHQNFKLTLMH
jgi:hypothetical protein